jgi:hypothetical protein
MAEKNDVNECSRATDCYADISRGLFNWWKQHPEQAKEVAAKIVEFGVGDTYLDEVEFENDGVIVRVLTLWDVKESEPDLDVIIERMRAVFGCKVDLWCVGTIRHFGDDV